MKNTFLLLLVPLFAFSSNYSKCGSCHGRTADWKSIGTERSLKSHSESELLNKMRYYRDEQPNKSALSRAMSNRLSGKSDKELKDLVKTIIDFKAKSESIESECSYQIL